MQRFTIQLTKTISVAIDAGSEAEAIDRAVNEDDINNGDWERAEHRARITNRSPLPEFEPSVQRIREDADALDMAELYDPY